MQLYKLADMTIVGTIIGKRGSYGSLILRTRPEIPINNYTKFKYLFIQQTSVQYLPYFVKKWEKVSDAFWLSLEEIDSPEQARKLIGQRVYVSSGQIQVSANAYPNLQNYRVISQGQVLGIIQKVLFLPQATAQVFIDQQEVLLPLHPDQIRHINTQDKIIHLEIPAGLIDIYL